ncbi:MAG: Gx transporter family protein [Prevotella sp.]|nr:Gx transporter family protein [Staphylococcus sp.]MCM1350713.1 Gx transporter family protein [Prevotella sp.]
MKKETKRFAILSIMIGLSLVLSYVDSLIPIVVTIPGIKLGLANIATIYVLYRLGIKEAIIASILRVFLSALLFGTVVTLSYSLVGAILSLLTMILLKKYTSFHAITISIVGAVMHNMGQIGVAILIMSTKEIIYYLPILVITGVISGIGVGLLAILVLKYTQNIFHE